MARFTYRLPLSYVRITGTAKYISDPLAAPGEQVAEPQAQIELVVGADEWRPRSLDLDPRRWRDGASSLEFTEDGRLTSQSAEVVGQGGKALTGLVTVVTSVAGALTAIAGPRAVAPLSVDQDPAAGAALQRLQAERDDADGLAAAVEAAYKRTHPEEAELREKLLEINKKLATGIADSIARVHDSVDRPARLEAQQELRSRLNARESLRPDLEKANAHFTAWRAGTQKAREERHEYHISLDEVRWSKVSVDETGTVTFPDPSPGDNEAKLTAAQAEIRQAWEHLGVVVLVDDRRSRILREDVHSVPDAASHAVVVRIPREVTLRVFTRNADAKAVLKSTQPVSVLDSLCDHQEVEVRAGVFGEGKGRLSFHSGGTLAKIEASSKSGVAAAADALGGLPATVAQALETTNKIADQYGNLSDKRIELALARAKDEHDLKQKQIELSGLNATEADHAELQRLKQQLDLLKTQKEMAGFSPATPDVTELEIARLKQEVELLKAQRQLDRLRGQSPD